MSIGILPHALRKEKNLALLPVGSVDWPLGQPDHVLTLGDLTPEDHLVVYPSSTRLLRRNAGLTCKLSLLMAEPHTVHGKYYALLGLIRKKFTFVISSYAAYANKYSNVLTMPVVESWVNPKYEVEQHKKTKKCSLIASKKRDLVGHRLRHTVASWAKINQPNIELLGRGYQSFENKEDGLLPYHYSIVIENCQEADYFTEKLLDAMLCDCLPIYWGCPNIASYFNPEGLIICNNEAELKIACSSLETPTQVQIAAATKNKKIAASLSNLNLRICQLISLH
jgi:hypothetical protein